MERLVQFAKVSVVCSQSLKVFPGRGLGREFHGDIAAFRLLAVYPVEQTIIEKHHITRLDFNGMVGQVWTSYAKNLETGVPLLRLEYH